MPWPDDGLALPFAHDDTAMRSRKSPERGASGLGDVRVCAGCLRTSLRIITLILDQRHKERTPTEARRPAQGFDK